MAKWVSEIPTNKAKKEIWISENGEISNQSPKEANAKQQKEFINSIINAPFPRKKTAKEIEEEHKAKTTIPHVDYDEDYVKNVTKQKVTPIVDIISLDSAKQKYKNGEKLNLAEAVAVMNYSKSEAERTGTPQMANNITLEKITNANAQKEEPITAKEAITDVKKRIFEGSVGSNAKKLISEANKKITEKDLTYLDKSEQAEYFKKKEAGDIPAQQYLDSKTDKINMKKGMEIAENYINGNFGDKVSAAFYSWWGTGSTQAGNNLMNFGDVLSEAIGGNGNIKSYQTTPAEYANAYLANYFTKNGKNIEKAIQDVVVNVANNVTLQGAGMLTGSKFVALAPFAMSVFSGAYQNEIKNGYSSKDATKYALATTAAETAGELASLLITGMPTLKGFSGDAIVEKITKNIKSSFLRGVTKLGFSTLGETVEESFQFALDPYLRNWILKEDNGTLINDWDEQKSGLFYSGLIGSASAFLMGSLSTVADIRIQKDIENYGKMCKTILEKTDLDIKDVATFGLESDKNSDLYETSKGFLDGQLKETDYNVGKLFKEANKFIGESNNFINGAYGQKIKSETNGIENIVKGYDDMVANGAQFSYEITNAAEKIKNDLSTGKEIDAVKLGEFARKIAINAPTAQIKGELKTLLQPNENGGIINNNQEMGVDIDGNTNTKLLAGGKVSATSGSGNSIWQQSENSKALSDRLERFSGQQRESSERIQAGDSGWLVRGGQTSQIWSGFKKGIYRKLSGIKLKDTDSVGRRLSDSVQKRFANTVLKTEDGTLISIFHYTQNKFDEFEYGDIGFHGGTLLATFDRQDDNAELGKPHIFKEMYFNVTNPLYFESDGGVWDAEAVASRAKAIGVVTQNEYKYLKQLEGFHYGKYSDEAYIELRRILKEKGYDGIIYINEHEDKGNLSVIVFDADQILTVAENGVLKENIGVSEATSDNGAAFSSPENADLQSSAKENGDTDTESRRPTFREPSDQEIYREPTAQENEEAIFGERKNAKQRHILDVAKKLDKGLKVVFVPNDSKVLNGKKGKYVPDTKTMYLAKDLKTVEAYNELFKHEFVHRLELRKAYGSFKDYLFNKSVAFENYAKTRLRREGINTENLTRQEAIDKLVDMYLKNFKGDTTIPQDIRDSFTREKAEREAVADFVARTLFKGNTAELRVALTEDINALVNVETDLDLFSEMAKKDRNLLQKIIDAIRDFINNIKGVPQFQTLQEDLQYLEERLTRVYNSADNKKTATESGEVYQEAKLSGDELRQNYKEPINNKDVELLKSIKRKPINQFTNDDLLKAEKWAYKFYEQLGSKSPFFRLWFGDWRAHDSGASNLIKTKGELRKSSVKNKDTEWEIVVSRQVTKETNHHSGDNEINAIKYLPYIIDITENAVLLNSEISDKENPLSAMFHSMYAYTEVMGYPALLKLQVEELINEKDGSAILRDYILQNIEEEPISLGKRFSKAHHHETDSSVISISDLFALVKQYDKSFEPKPSSAIVDNNGKPLIVYHGTDEKFSEFDTTKQRTSGKLNFGKGIYLTPNRNIAEMYSNTGNVMELFAVVKKPYEIFSTRLDNADLQELSNEFGEEVTLDNVDKVLQKNGYDGIIARTYNGTTNPINQIVVFKNTQVKSATNNIGTFDNENANISYSSDDLDIPNQTSDLLDRHEKGEITREQLMEELDKLYGEANQKYGIIKEGEKSQTPTPVAVPKAVAEDKPTEQFTRTILETGKLTEDMVESMETEILLGNFSYKVSSDEKAMKEAETAIKTGVADDLWTETVNTSARISKNQVAIGEQLLANAIAANDTIKVLNLSAELADVFTRAGQVVQAARLLKKMTGAGRLVSLQKTVKTINKDLVKKYGDKAPEIKISEEIAKLLVNAKSTQAVEQAYQEVMQEVANQVPVTWLDKWNAWRYWAMLCNPKTHIRNLVGNAIFTPAVRIKDFIAAGTEAVVIKDKSKRTKSMIIKKEYTDFAKKDGSKNEVKQLLKGNKYNDKTALKEKQQIFKTKALEFITRFNSNALEAEDMLFKNKHYVHALAGYLQARNVNLNSVSEDILSDARIYAVNEARKATFNDESALANWVQNFGNKNLATNIMVEGVLPYKRTPINIVKRGVEYSPIGLIKTLTKGVYDVKKGKITATEFIDGLASGLTGTGIMIAGMVLANLGLISGGEDDDKESVFEKMLGKQEYAVEFAGKSYTIDWAAPACIPFFIGVEIVNIINSEEEFSFSKFSNVIWNALEPITNLSMLSGIQSVIESTRYADSSQTLWAIASDAMTSYAMQGVPSVMGAVGRTIDPTQRSWYTDKNDKWLDSTAQTIKNNIQSKIPGLSYTQIPKIDAWGREVSRGSVGERVLENFISPGYYSEIEYNEVNEELKRLFVKTGDNVFPKTAAKSFQVNGETKQLTAEEYVVYAKAKGEYSFDYINEFFDSSAYKKLSDDERAEVVENLYEYANAKAKSKISDYDLLAKGSKYKTVINWERNGGSPVIYYISRAKSK